MTCIPGIQKPDLHALPTIKERITFLYVEHCLINRQDGAVTITDTRGTAYVPAASLGVLMLGPGTNVSHRAMELLGDAGASIVWVGERGVRYYAHGRPLTHSSHLVVRQAELVSNKRKRLAVARAMYQMRFPGENVSHLTMQQLRGREGSRIRSLYRRLSEEFKVPWKGREYNPDDFEDATSINQALSAAHVCLYGAVHSVIVALGCSPALGFVHMGHERSFVYDIADLYKAEVTIPIAFQVASEVEGDVGATTRRRVRDAFLDGRIMERVARDVRRLLLNSDDSVNGLDEIDFDTMLLWDERDSAVRFGVSYGREYDAPITVEVENNGSLVGV
ncbi:type I-E CRISPR-associated endonuclease Cas1e [Slackia exigua]|uniref:CRISPR-associated endonuclease Cas1 n=1 Tax=Slackia exigua (strain ATCC 700122 / DSM 15923 / CIP 105133 / JCM 11022 / KCTC 5966 / S-7) TaxID=649764 RepID=D0WFC6_SLAES|nr:type I-E CRISPR-associated endonuclease Cas1e [Slackia exigua]EEZ61810.1 CRISPR-associated endonuclease Cas1 [Slackia exigua ATCC 700122]STN98797.1 CRISPR-associated endonuclease Cas1, subtype I-E/ECOLI [Slackia exigua]